MQKYLPVTQINLNNYVQMCMWLFSCDILKSSENLLTTLCEFLTFYKRQEEKEMKGSRKDHGAVDKPSSVQQLCK